MTEVHVTLPGGFLAEGEWHRGAVLREITGRDELFLAETRGAYPLVFRVTLLLARCLERLGPFDSVTPEMVRALALGDREALLLHLRRLMLGERIDCTLKCPASGCGADLDLELSVGDLLQPPYPHAREVHERPQVRFRVPNGGDMESIAAAAAAGDPDAGARALMSRCVVGVARGDGWRVPEEADLDALADVVAPLMAELDPQADLVLRLTCSECGQAFETLFDAAHVLFREARARQTVLLGDVHRLALNYHWSESDILALSTARRRFYLSLLAGAPGGDA